MAIAQARMPYVAAHTAGLHCSREALQPRLFLLHCLHMQIASRDCVLLYAGYTCIVSAQC
jgi:hypothetical protein